MEALLKQCEIVLTKNRIKGSQKKVLNFLQEACRTHPEDYLSTSTPTTSVQLKHKTIINNGGKKGLL